MGPSKGLLESGPVSADSPAPLPRSQAEAAQPGPAATDSGPPSESEAIIGSWHPESDDHDHVDRGRDSSGPAPAGSHWANPAYWQVTFPPPRLGPGPDSEAGWPRAAAAATAGDSELSR